MLSVLSCWPCASALHCPSISHQVKHGYAEDQNRAAQFRRNSLVRRLALHDWVLTFDILEGSSRDCSVAVLSWRDVRFGTACDDVACFQHFPKTACCMHFASITNTRAAP